MGVFETVCSRRSFKSCKYTPIERDKIALLLEAARWAPSPGNMQSWCFIVVDDPEKLKRLASYTPDPGIFKDVPVVIVLCSDIVRCQSRFGEDAERYALLEAAMAAENMALVAFEQGLGTRIISEFDKENVKTLLAIHEEVDPVLVLLVGYPKEYQDQPPKFLVTAITYINEFGQRLHPVYDKYEWKGIQEYAKEAKKKYGFAKKSFDEFKSRLRAKTKTKTKKKDEDSSNS